MSLRHGSSTSERRSGRSHSDCLCLLDLLPLSRVLPLRRFSLPVSSLAKNRCRPLASSSPCAVASVRFCFSPTIRRSKELTAAHFFFPPSCSFVCQQRCRRRRPKTGSPLLSSLPSSGYALPHSNAAAVFIHQHRPPSLFSLVSSTGSCPPRLLLIASAAASPPSFRHPPLNLAGAAACLFFSAFRRRHAFPSSLPPASSPSSSSATTSLPSPPSSPPLLLHRCRHDVGMGIG